MKELLASQHVVVAGLGMTGQSVVRFLTNIGASVTAWDTREGITVPEWVTIPVHTGVLPADFWQNVDTLVLSPGISVNHEQVQNARKAGVEIIGDIELYARMNRTPALGVTGSNGKTTVTLLLTHILNANGLRACAAGNVGTPVLDTVGGEWDFLVLELSSFQLETTSSLHLRGATILNVSDDHLDRHGSMQAYTSAKQRIFAHCDHALVWRAQRETRPFVHVEAVTEFGLDDNAKHFGYRDSHILWQGKPILNMAKVALAGRHNALNIQAALGLARLAGIEPEDAAEAVYTFKPAPHRCVEIANTHGIHWVDDSKATNVGATIAALEGLHTEGDTRLILIAGGDAKGADLSALKPALNRYVDLLITIGKDGKAISELMPGSHFLPDMAAAVALAAQQAKPGDTVLLSPACASLDMFSNYAHRAEVFAHSISEVAVS